MIQIAYGTVGSGKSTLLHDLVKAQSKVQRFFCMDHEQGWCSDAFHWRNAAPIVTDVEKDVAFPDFELPGVYRFRSIQFDPREVAQICLELPFDCCFVDDEIDKAGRKAEFDKSPIRKIINEGRHIETEDGVVKQVHLIGGCRRPQKLHNDFDLAHEFFIFRLQGTRTLQRLRDDAVIEDVEWERIRLLPNFHFKFHSGMKNEWLTVPCLTHDKHACEVKSCAGEFTSVMDSESDDD